MRQALESLRQQRQSVIAQYTRFDGHAAARIGDLLVSAIDGVNPTDSSAAGRNLPGRVGV